MKSVTFLFAMLCGAVALAGEITHPEDGACYGWGAVPVPLVDTFDPGLPRTYTPALPEPRPRQHRLTAPDMAEHGSFGRSIALAGDMLLVGATGGRGAVHEFRRSAGQWTHVRRIVLEGLTKRTSFGIRVATDGGHAIVGAVNPQIEGQNIGGVFAYRIDASGWTPVPIETPADLMPGDIFAGSLGLGEDRLCVGASGADVFGSNSGAAYVYRFDGTGWILEQRLTGDDLGRGTSFGRDCAFAGGELFVGADDRIRNSDRGRVYVYERDGDGWSKRQVLSTGRYRDYFGSSVDAEGDLLAVGARNTGDGTVHLFERVAGTWVEAAAFGIEGPGIHGDLGFSVAIDGARVVAGSINEDLTPHGNTNEGLAHEFARGPTSWRRTDRWAAFDAARDGFFGYDVAIEGDTTAVGSILTQDKGWSTGSVYVQEGEPIRGYRTHGDLTASLSVAGAGQAEVSFTIDLRLPRVDFTLGSADFVAPVALPAAEVFAASDDDGASGGVVHESLLWGDCPIFDGNAYGNGDGLLSDEILVLDEPAVCEAVRRCGGFPEDRRMRVEVRDCAGNVGSDTHAGEWNPISECP